VIINTYLLYLYTCIDGVDLWPIVPEFNHLSLTLFIFSKSYVLGREATILFFFEHNGRSSAFQLSNREREFMYKQKRETGRKGRGRWGGGHSRRKKLSPLGEAAAKHKQKLSFFSLCLP
jgi:hypothetical protein